MKPLSDLAKLHTQYCQEDGQFDTHIEGLILYRASFPQLNMASVMRPAIGLVVQGAKKVSLGNRHWSYGASDYLLICAELPLHSTITQATWQAPYLGLSIDLDLADVTEMAARAGIDFTAVSSHPCPVSVQQVGEELADAIGRFVRLLRHPSDARAMAPLLRKEIVYYLLRSGQAPALKRIAISTPGYSALEALRWLRENFREPLSIESLARSLSVSPSGLHHQFKALTSTSPLQYQKLLRLQEARNLLLTESDTASNIGQRVGYRSPSQFSREYKRLCGGPPSGEAARWKRSAR